MHFADRAFIAEVTAKMLLESRRCSSTRTSPSSSLPAGRDPVYIDCRKLIFYPRIRTQLLTSPRARSRATRLRAVRRDRRRRDRGIPYAAWIADRMGLPLQYVRKKPKGFGRNAQIEGDIREGARTLLVEDLTTDGRSKINFCKALRERGRGGRSRLRQLLLRHLPRIEEGDERARRALHYLATWWDVLGAVKKGGYLEASKVAEVEKFLHAPAQWSAAHGGVSSFPSQ
jgi:orotate phosphoribosyltransferase